MTKENLEIIQKLTGAITQDQLKLVDCFPHRNISVFIPAVGPCQFSITPDHTHPGYMFIIPHDSNSSMAIEDKVISYQTGFLSAVSPNIIHHEIQNDDFSRFTAIMADKYFFESIWKEYSSEKIPVFKGKWFKLLPVLLPKIREFMSEWQNTNPGRLDMLDALERITIHQICRNILLGDNVINVPVSSDRIQEIMHYIQTNPAQELSVGKLAEKAAMSESTFYHRFKKETGESPAAYIISARLEQARKMILSADKNISEIAELSGYNSLSRFSTSFTSHFGTSPASLRNKFRKD